MIYAERRKLIMHRITTFATYLLVAWIVFAGIEIHSLTVYARQWSSAEQNMVIIEKVFSNLKDCESGQRGYIITSDPDYLVQYNTGTFALAYDLEVLRAYLEPDVTEKRFVTELLGVVDAKRKEMRVALEAFNTGNFKAAQVIIRTNKGARQMKHIRYLMDVIRAHEQASIKQSTLLAF